MNATAHPARCRAFSTTPLRNTPARKPRTRVDMCSFRDELLRHGPLPMALSEEQIKDWVARRMRG